jgi:hypothetical protein
MIISSWYNIKVEIEKKNLTIKIQKTLKKKTLLVFSLMIIVFF